MNCFSLTLIDIYILVFFLLWYNMEMVPNHWELLHILLNPNVRVALSKGTWQ